MTRFRLTQLSSVEQLRAAAPKWDDLWQRSDTSNPTVRAEMLAQWVEWFSRSDKFRALVVEDDVGYVAALPLVEGTRFPLLRTGFLTQDDWTTKADLLLDPLSEIEPVLDVLVDGIRELPWELLRLNAISLDVARWGALRQALDRAGVRNSYHAQTQQGVIEVGDDWKTFVRRLSKKHRHNMERCHRRLSERGEVRLEFLSQLGPSDVESEMLSAIEIENRSWKGQTGTSMLRVPKMVEYFIRQARQLAEWRQLEFAFLHCGEQRVAFIYGYSVKGVSSWFKIGYDPEYASCTPGQLAQYHLLERLHAEPEIHAVDTLGPLTHALSKWNPTRLQVGPLMIAPRQSLTSNMLYSCTRRVEHVKTCCTAYARRKGWTPYWSRMGRRFAMARTRARATLHSLRLRR